jgi:thiamine-phosphate pyrophosphorylase
LILADIDIGTARHLQRGSGVLVIADLTARERRQLRTLARNRGLSLVVESPRTAARVHNVRELRAALLNRVPLILLSPIHKTPSHPDWRPIPPMRAATLARLADRRLFALGGMDSKRYVRIARLGFIGWAGISAFRT